MTSSIFKKGKNSVLKLCQKNPLLQEKVSVFGQQSTSIEEISKVGIETFVLLYGRNSGDMLRDLRFKMAMKMVSTSSKVCPSKLPPLRELHTSIA